MSVLVRGMEMPTSCCGCPIDSDACKLWTQLPATALSKSRHNDCPLIPVPEHGRLIDAYNTVKKLCDSGYFNAAEIVSDMPTIIPADKEGEG